MIYEFAITPGVFSPSLCNNRDQWKLQLRYLAKGIMTDGLVADLQDGYWSQFVHSQQINNNLTLEAKELLKELRNNNRLRLRPIYSSTLCVSDDEWLSESIRCYEEEPLHGIVTSHFTYNNIHRPVRKLKRNDEKKMVASTSHIGEENQHIHIQGIEKIDKSNWWINRPSSKLVKRTAQDYVETLTPILRQANSLMFIDPFINPDEQRYETVAKMIKIAFDRPSTRPNPVVEIHRACYEGHGLTRRIVQREEWMARFNKAGWNQFTYEVFIWDDFHDRHLISDLCGINLAYGFDASVRLTDQTTTWSRLDRNVRDQIQREFDSASNIHRLHHRFRINAG